MLKGMLRSVLLGAVTLCAAPVMAQDYAYSVLIDVDRQSGSGCTVDLGGGNVVTGVERRLSALSGSGVFQVSSLTVETCAGGSFGPPTGVGGPYPIGLDNGLGGADVVELGATIEQLTGSAYPAPFRVYFAAESAAGSDLIGSGAGGGPIVVGAPAAPVPGLGWAGLAVLILASILILRSRRLRPMLRNGSLALLVLGSGLVIAANFALDGNVGDWGSQSPQATDPAGDSTSGQSAIDLTAAFVAIENGRLFFRVDVRDVQNNAPVANPVAASGLEDTPLVVTLSGSDNESPAISFAIASPPASGTLGAIIQTSPTTAEVTYTPAADSNGTDAFTFTVSDGDLTSPAALVSLDIQPVNDAPSFSPQNATLYEDAGPQTAVVATALSAGPADESGQSFSFEITGNDNSTLFSGTPTISPAGVLTATPAPGMLGSATLTVVMRDSGGTANGGVDESAPQSIMVTVDDVNDAPGFTPGADPVVLEDAGAQSIANWATAIDDGDGGGQTLTFTVQANSNPALFSAAPALDASGTLTFTTADDANGSADITITLSDDGGTANGGVDTSAPHTFTILVTPVNDAPSFTAANPPPVFQDSGPAEVTGWATFTAGPANESSQAVAEYQVSAISNPALFSAAPTVDDSGTLRYTPAAGARGTSQFTVRVRDDGGTSDGGVDLSTPQTFTIDVEAVNNAPVFTPGPDVNVLEDAGAQSVANWATGMDDNDGGTQVLGFLVQANSNPALFATAPAIDAGTGTLTFTPAVDANGSAQVTVVLQDDGGTANGGTDTSAPHVLTITVAPVNDAPSFTLQDPAPGLEDAGAQSVSVATAISAGPADESSQAVTFILTPVSSDPTLSFAAVPAISSSGVLSYSADTNAWGTATFSVVAQDDGGTADGGVDTSPAQVLTITVTAVNDMPSFTAANPPASAEDAGAQTVAGWVTTFDPGPNEAAQAVAEYQVANVTNPSLFAVAPAVAADGTLTYTAAADQHGTSQFTVRVRDNGGTANGGVDLSAPETFTLTVTPVNDPPAVDLNGPAAGTGYDASFIEGGVPVPIVDAAAMTVTDIDSNVLVEATLTLASAPDGSDEVLAVNVGGSGLSAAYAGGVLTLTGNASVADYQAVLRTATYSNVSNNPDETPRQIAFLVEDDGGGVSAPAVATVAVAGVNSPPQFVPGSDQAVLEDAGAQTVTAWATGIGDGDDGTQALTFVIQDNTNPSLFSAGPSVAADGTLSFTPAADAFGNATITIALQDDGGNANGGNDTSPSATLQISVTPVNDAPSFTVPSQAPVALENSGAQTVAGFAQDIVAGPANESGQALTFSVSLAGTTGTLAFSSAPAIDATTGTLTYTPQADTSGTATVNVQLGDDGGTANGGVDTSAVRSFTITVEGVNSAPVFTPGSDVTVYEDAAPYSQAWATGIDDGDADEVQGLEFIVQSNTNAALFATPPAVDAATGNLSFTLTADAFGSADITLVLRDDAGTANGGVDTSAPVTFTITAEAVNDAPGFDMPASAPAVLEDAGAQTVVAFASNLSAGPANESSQALLGFDVSIDAIDSTLGFTTAPAIDASTGTLTYAAAANAFGTATLTATLRDDGGTANGGVDSFSRTFTITVNGVNDPPSFTPGGNVTVQEDAGAQNQAWATGMDDGDGGTQVLDFNVGNDNPTLFSAPPAISPATGNLSFIPAPNAFGVANVTVTLVDNGGTANGGVDTSAPASFTITVEAVNDPPVVVVPANVPVHRNIGIVVPAAHAYNLLADVTDVDGPGAQPFSLTAVTGAASTAGGRYTVDSDGAWTYDPPASNTATTDSFDVQVCDSGVPLPSACTTATVTVALSGTAIWFVDPSAPAGGTGTLSRPFQTLAQAASAAGINSRIFLYSGSHTGGVTLLNGQQVIGQAATASSFDTLFGISPPALSVARPALGGSRPLITTTAAATHAFTLASNNTIRAIEIGATTGAALNGSGFGTLTLGENRISGAGQALNLSNGTLAQLAGFDAFDQVTSTSGASNIALSAVGGAASLGGGTLSGASGTAFSFSTGSATLTYSGDIVKTAAGTLVDISGAGAATLSLSGNLSCTGNCGTGSGNAGIRVSGRTGGTYTFSGANKTVSSSGSNPGVSLTGNSAATAVHFVNGGLAVTTLTGAAFHADSGTVSVTTGTNANMLSAAAGVALNLTDATIAAADVTFRSISSTNSPSAGIILDNTGNLGSLMVTGNGGTCSSAASCTGGAIQNAGTHGIWLRSTTEPSIDRMFIDNTRGHGVGGTEVNGFSLTNSHIARSGTDMLPRRANIGFNEASSGTERNLYGVVTITGNTLQTSSGFGVELYNFNGTVSHANISNNQLTSSTSAAQSSGWGISLIAYGSATTAASVTRADINANVITNFPGGGGIQAQGGNPSAAGPVGVFGTAGHPTDVIRISGNRIAGASPVNRMGAEAIVALVNGRGQGNFNISNNGTLADPIARITGTGISNSAFGQVTVTSVIENNVIVANNSFGSQGIGGGLGFSYAKTDQPLMTVTVRNNNISQVDGNGILLVARDTNGRLNARVQNNTVAAPLTGMRPGIRIDSGNTQDGDNDTVCLDISGNTSAGSGGTNGIGLRKQGAVPNQFAFGIVNMAASATPGVETYVNGLNPGGNGTLLISATSGFSNCLFP
jgi:hypothetical protein